MLAAAILLQCYVLLLCALERIHHIWKKCVCYHPFRFHSIQSLSLFRCLLTFRSSTTLHQCGLSSRSMLQFSSALCHHLQPSRSLDTTLCRGPFHSSSSLRLPCSHGEQGRSRPIVNYGEGKFGGIISIISWAVWCQAWVEIFLDQKV